MLGLLVTCWTSSYFMLSPDREADLISEQGQELRGDQADLDCFS